MKARMLLFLAVPLAVLALLFATTGCDEPDPEDLAQVVYRLVIRPMYVDPNVAEFEGYMAERGFHDGSEFRFPARCADEFFEAAFAFRPGRPGAVVAPANAASGARELRDLGEAMRVP